ncbi:hypothetical protein JHK86_006404 [Glycine max]|nr:hypothetical protein JHK86_006404 [Glycine max]
MADQGDLYERDGIVLDRSKRDKSRVSNPLMKWALLTTTSEDKMQKYGRSKVGSRVVSYHEDQSEDSVPVSFVSKDLQRNGKESEDSEAAVKSTQSTEYKCFGVDQYQRLVSLYLIALFVISTSNIMLDSGFPLSL